MAPASRQCSFCNITSCNSPNTVLFTVTEHIQNALNLATSDSKTFICEHHFLPDDIRDHGTSKRLREGALPVNFPRRDTLCMDHNYVLTSELDLETGTLEECLDECPGEVIGAECIVEGYDEDAQDFEDSPPSSQFLQSSGSSFFPSQQSSGNSDFNEEPESNIESEGVDMDGAHLIVSWSCLVKLLSICQHPGCGDQVLTDSMDITRNGAAIHVKMTCNHGHNESWSNSKVVGKGNRSMPVINLLIIVYAFLSGLQFDQLKAFFDHCNVFSVSSSTFYRRLKSIVYPVVWTYWLIQQARNIAQVQVVHSLNGVRNSVLASKSI